MDSQITRLEVREQDARGRVVARIDREHNSDKPWMLTVLPDDWPPDLARAAAAGRYTTEAQTPQEADRVLQQAAAVVLRYLEQRAALDLAVRQEVRRAADQAAQETLPGVEP